MIRTDHEELSGADHYHIPGEKVSFFIRQVAACTFVLCFQDQDKVHQK